MQASCNLINFQDLPILWELGPYRVFPRLSLMKIPEPLLNLVLLCFLAHYMKIR